MERRNFLRSSVALLGVLPFLHFGQLSPLQLLSDTGAEVVQIKLGTASITVFRDVVMQYQVQRFFTNANAHELSQALAKIGLKDQEISSPFIAMLVELNGRKVLIDTGVGYLSKPLQIGDGSVEFRGRLQQLLRQQHVNKKDITDVIITHFHPDHIGGIISEDDQLNGLRQQYLV